MVKTTAPESQEQTSIQTIDPNIGEKLVRQFLEKKLNSDTGVEFYNASKWDKCIGTLGEFKAYYKDKKEWNDLATRKIIENVGRDYLYREFISYGTSFESKRKALVGILEREFELPKDKAKLVTKIESLSLEALGKHLLKKPLRQKLIEESFPKETIVEHDMRAQFDTIFGKKKLTSSQEENMARLLLSSKIDESEIIDILDLFTTLEDKQLIIKFFFPTITLGDLATSIGLSNKQVRDIIEKSIGQDYFDTKFKLNKEDINDVIDKIDSQDIIIPTYLFPEDVVDAILGTKKTREIIAKAIEETNQETIKESEEENSLELVPDKNNKFLPDFQEKLRILGIPNSENFTTDSYVHGKIKQSDGTFVTFHFAITAIKDNPDWNNTNDGDKRQITVKSIITSDGSINKNWRTSSVRKESFNYDDMFAILENAVKGREGFPEITTQEMLDAQVENGDLKEEILQEDINNFEELKNALDLIDQNGKGYPLEEGSSIQVGKPGDKNFWVFQIKSINKEAHSIVISDGISQELIGFKEFFENFKSKEGTRLPKMGGPKDFLQNIQNFSPKGKDFAKIIFNESRGLFMPEDNKDDKDFPGILQFGGEKETITIHEIDANGTVIWTIGEWEEGTKEDKTKKIKATPGKYKAGSKGYKTGWNALYSRFLTLNATPTIPDVALTAPEQRNTKEAHLHNDPLKKYMGNPSIHDMFTGAKNLVDFLKHKLEHGSKTHAAEFQLALGKKLGLNEATMRELRNKVHGKSKELMEEMVKDLSGLPSGERQEEVKHILLNKGSHGYEIQAAILAMLKKHGNLYVGKPLKGLEGSFLFFERLSGTKYSKNNEHVQRALKQCKDKGILFREEFLIESYLQFIGGKAGGYQVDWNLWLDIKRGWADGMKGEGDSGEMQAGMFGTLDGRLNWVYEKFEGGEYSNAIGAMKKVWSKGGPAHKMHEPAIYLALSNISTRLHGSQLDALKNEFYGGGHPYPALTSLFTPEKLTTFQETIKILCKGNVDMEAAYKKVESARSTNVGDSMAAIRSFWSTYGPELHKKLIMSQDPDVLYKAEHDPDPKTREVLGSYINNYTDDTKAIEKFNQDELENGVYDYNQSGYAWNPEMYLKNARVDRGPGTIGDDKGTVTMWEGYLKSLDNIKDIKVTEDPEENRVFQQKRYKEYHKAFYNTILQRVGADWADKGNDGKTKIEKQTYMSDLQRRGFSIPTWRDVKKLEEPEYEQLVLNDFDVFMKKDTEKTTENEKEVVAKTISSLLEPTPVI